MCIFSSILQYQTAIFDSETCNNIYFVYDIVMKSQHKRVLQNQYNVYLPSAVRLGRIDPSINFRPKCQTVPGFEQDLRRHIPEG